MGSFACHTFAKGLKFSMLTVLGCTATHEVDYAIPFLVMSTSSLREVMKRVPGPTAENRIQTQVCLTAKSGLCDTSQGSCVSWTVRVDTEEDDLCTQTQRSVHKLQVVNSEAEVIEFPPHLHHSSLPSHAVLTRRPPPAKAVPFGESPAGLEP